MNLRFSVSTLSQVNDKMTAAIQETPFWDHRFRDIPDGLVLQMNGDRALFETGEPVLPPQGPFSILTYEEAVLGPERIQGHAAYHLGIKDYRNRGEDPQMLVIDWLGEFNVAGAGMSFHSAWMHRLREFRADSPWGERFDFPLVHRFGAVLDRIIVSLEDKNLTVPRIFFREFQERWRGDFNMPGAMGIAFQKAFQNADRMLRVLGGDCYAKFVWPGGETPEAWQLDKALLINHIGVMAFLAKFPGGPIR